MKKAKGKHRYNEGKTYQCEFGMLLYSTYFSYINGIFSSDSERPSSDTHQSITS